MRACTDGSEMDVMVALPSHGPSFFLLPLSCPLVIITELSKHDLGELVGKGDRQRKRDCEAGRPIERARVGSRKVPDRSNDLLPPKSQR